MASIVLGLDSDDATVVGTGIGGPNGHHRPAAVGGHAGRPKGDMGHLRSQPLLCQHDLTLHPQVCRKVSKLCVCVL